MSSKTRNVFNDVTQYQNFSEATGIIIPDNSSAVPTEIDIESSSEVHFLAAPFPIPTASTETAFDNGQFSSLSLEGSEDLLKFWQDGGKLYGTYSGWANRFELPQETQPGIGQGQLNISLQEAKPWLVGELLME